MVWRQGRSRTGELRTTSESEEPPGGCDIGSGKAIGYADVRRHVVVHVEVAEKSRWVAWGKDSRGRVLDGDGKKEEGMVGRGTGGEGKHGWIG